MMPSYTSYKNKLHVLDANDDNIETWITVNGNHIPIMKGQSKEEAVKNFIAKKSDKESSARSNKPESVGKAAKRAVSQTKKNQETYKAATKTSSVKANGQKKKEPEDWKTFSARTGITPEDFEAYEWVRESGAFNMFDYENVSRESGLPKDLIKKIQQNYEEADKIYNYDPYESEMPDDYEIPEPTPDEKLRYYAEKRVQRQEDLANLAPSSGGYNVYYTDFLSPSELEEYEKGVEEKIQKEYERVKAASVKAKLDDIDSRWHGDVTNTIRELNDFVKTQYSVKELNNWEEGGQTFGRLHQRGTVSEITISKELGDYILNEPWHKRDRVLHSIQGGHDRTGWQHINSDELLRKLKSAKPKDGKYVVTVETTHTGMYED